MNALIEKVTGLDKMSDQVIATDLLVSAKSAVRNYSIALTETTSQDVRTVLRKQLNDAIAAHETMFNYMMKKGYYNAYNFQEQYKVDMQTTETALNLS
jgi:similar to spore coat protein